MLKESCVFVSDQRLRGAHWDFLLLAAAALWRRRVSPVSTAHSPKKELARGLGAKLEPTSCFASSQNDPQTFKMSGDRSHAPKT